MSLQYQNFYETTLNAAVTSTDTYFPLVTPPTVGESYLLIDWDVPSKREFIYYTSKDATGVNVTLANRGKDGTAAIPHSKNAKVRMNLNAAMITDIINNVKQNPIGSIHLSTVSTNPSDASQLGYGTWVAWGTGRVPVGVDATQSEFNTVEKTGGQKDLMAHSHNAPTSGGGVSGGFEVGGAGPNTVYGTSVYDYIGAAPTTTTGTGTNNMNPYITVYMWKRTA